MTVGKTHSGKTTFGREIKQSFPETIFFDSDILGDFLKTNYPWMYDPQVLPLNEEGITAGKSLQVATRLEILKKASQTDLPLFISAAHARKESRQKMLKLAHDYQRTLILVFFNYSEKLLLERIKHSDRDKICLVESKNYEYLLLHKQKAAFEVPTPDEADYFFEVTDEDSLTQTKQKIHNLLKSF